MPLYLCKLNKAINTSGIQAKWSNVYFVQANDSSEAVTMGNVLWGNGERGFHNQLAFCYSIYVNNTEDPPNTPGLEVPVQSAVQRGTRSATAASTLTILPLANVVRVDYPVAASRPSRKFYRIPLLEGDIQELQLVGDLPALLQTGINALASQGWLRDPDGQAYVGSGIIKGLTTRRLGRESGLNVPTGPAFG